MLGKINHGFQFVDTCWYTRCEHRSQRFLGSLLRRLIYFVWVIDQLDFYFILFHFCFTGFRWFDLEWTLYYINCWNYCTGSDREKKKPLFTFSRFSLYSTYESLNQWIYYVVHVELMSLDNWKTLCQTALSRFWNTFLIDRWNARVSFFPLE